MKFPSRRLYFPRQSAGSFEVIMLEEPSALFYLFSLRSSFAINREHLQHTRDAKMLSARRHLRAHKRVERREEVLFKHPLRVHRCRARQSGAKGDGVKAAVVKPHT